MAAEISFCDLPCLFYCMEGEFEHISRNSVWALRTKTINCSVGFIDFYSLFHTNLRIVLPPPQCKALLLQYWYCGTKPKLWAAVTTKIQSCQIAQTKCKWCSDELRSGSNKKWGGGGLRGFCGLVQMGWGWYLFVYQKIGGCIKFEVATWNHYPSASYLTVLLLFLLLFF